MDDPLVQALNAIDQGVIGSELPQVEHVTEPLDFPGKLYPEFLLRESEGDYLPTDMEGPKGA